MHVCREEVQSVEGQRSALKAAAKQAEAKAEARFQDKQLRRLEAMPEVERPWTIAALSISPQAAVRPWSKAHVTTSAKPHDATQDITRQVILL